MSQTKTGPLYRIIKDELTDGRGYRLTFVMEEAKEPEKPLLPLNPSDPGYLAAIAGLTRKKLDEDETKEPLFVYATNEGMSIIDEMGTNWVVETLCMPPKKAEPEMRLIAGTKACSLQRLNSPKKKETTSRLLRNETEVVDYLKRFGLTKRVSEALHTIASQLTSCKLEPTLAEYIAGQDFVLREYRMGETLQGIKLKVEALASDQEPGPFALTKRQWQHWFEQFAVEMAYVRELFFIVGYEKGEPYTQADFSLQSWLCGGVDAKTGRPLLTLIDQHPNLLGTPDSVMDMDDMVRSVRYRELMSRHRDNGTLALLRK